MSELSDLIEKYKTKTGSTNERLKKEIALMKFVARLDNNNRVIVEGTWQGEFHYPAVLVYDNIHKQFRIYYVEEIGKPLKLSFLIENFFSKNKFQSSCREVLIESEYNNTI